MSEAEMTVAKSEALEAALAQAQAVAAPCSNEIGGNWHGPGRREIQIVD